MSGFTLTELMVALAVVGILSSLALPGYRNYLRSTRRADGQASLIRMQDEQTRYRTNNPQYATALSALNISKSTSDAGYYTLSLSTPASATAYTVTVTAVGDQLKDAGCTTMSVSYTAVAGSAATYSYSPSTCWAQ